MLDTEMDPAECRRKYDLELSKLTHALQCHNQRIEALERGLALAADERREMRTVLSSINTAMHRVSRQMELVLDAIRLLSHAARDD